MSSNSCIKSLRILKNASIVYRSTPLRAFTSTSYRLIELPGPNAGPATSIPPVTPLRAEGEAQSQNTTAAANRTDSDFQHKTIPTAEAARSLRKTLGKGAETYTAYGVTEKLVAECASQANYEIPQAKDDEAEMPKTKDGEDLGVGSGWWHTELGLQPTFSTWSQVTMLHMYLLSARFRCFPAEQAQVWQQHLLDHFFYDAENRMEINHNMHARGTRNKYLKDLFIQWRGLLAAYDEGVVKGDGVLAAAVWRNIYKADEKVNIVDLATIVSYMRRVLKDLDNASDLAVTRGEVAFGSPGDERTVVDEKSQMMELPFKDGDIVNEPIDTNLHAKGP